MAKLLRLVILSENYISDYLSYSILQSCRWHCRSKFLLAHTINVIWWMDWERERERATTLCVFAQRSTFFSLLCCYPPSPSPTRNKIYLWSVKAWKWLNSKPNNDTLIYTSFASLSLLLFSSTFFLFLIKDWNDRKKTERRPHTTIERIPLSTREPEHIKLQTERA